MAAGDALARKQLPDDLADVFGSGWALDTDGPQLIPVDHRGNRLADAFTAPGDQSHLPGQVRVGGVDVTHVATADRGMAMVFQRPVLIPNRDVQRNIAFPLEVRHQPEGEISTRVAAETRALHIEALLARSPQGLSAGEAQLVQVARALVRRPSFAPSSRIMLSRSV